VVVAGALEDVRVKADVLADALDDDALEIVVVMCPAPLRGRIGAI